MEKNAYPQRGVADNVIIQNSHLIDKAIAIWHPIHPHKGDLRTTAMLAILWAKKEYHRYENNVEFEKFALTIIKNHLMTHICRESRLTYRQFYGHQEKPIFLDRFIENFGGKEKADNLAVIKDFYKELSKIEMKIARAISEGYSIPDITKQFGIPTKSIMETISSIKSKIENRFPDDVAGRCLQPYHKKLIRGNIRLGNEEINEILKRAKDGETYAHIARTLRIDASTVSKACIRNKIRRGKNFGAGVPLSLKISAYADGKKAGKQDKEIAKEIGCTSAAFAVSKMKNRNRFDLAYTAAACN